MLSPKQKISALTFIDTLLSSQRTRTHPTPTGLTPESIKGNCSSLSQLGLGHKARLLGDKPTLHFNRQNPYNLLATSVKTWSVSVALTRQKLREQMPSCKSAGKGPLQPHRRS
jgi:hypothetical protein